MDRLANLSLQSEHTELRYPSHRTAQFIAASAATTGQRNRQLMREHNGMLFAPMGKHCTNYCVHNASSIFALSKLVIERKCTVGIPHLHHVQAIMSVLLLALFLAAATNQSEAVDFPGLHVLLHTMQCIM